MKILICGEAQGGTVQPITLELIAAGRALAGSGDEVVLLIPGIEAGATGELGAADRAIVATHPILETATAEAYSRVAHAVTKREQPDIVLCGYTALGLDVAPDLAGRTGFPMVAYVTGLARDGDTIMAQSQVYGGKLIAATETPLPAIFMINPGRFAEAEVTALEPQHVAPVNVAGELDGLKVRYLGADSPETDGVDLTMAERIVCVGRGIGEEGSIDLARDFAELLAAEVAGTRPVIDSGWLPKPRQVGKSGQKVKPKLYVALGVSGAPEHLEGMGSADLIVAVNTDPNAPIFDVAHYGATCDLFDLLPILSERLKAQPSS